MTVREGVSSHPDNRAFSVEARGIEPIPEEERRGRPRELFKVWFAANVALLGVVYGAVAVSFGLNLWQAIGAGLLGTWLSFLLVGLISVAGARGGAPTLTLSRAAFGTLGNAVPNLVSYLSLLGWETVLVALSVLAAEELLGRLGVDGGTLPVALAFLVVVGVVAVGLLGHATIVRVQGWFTWSFAALTVVFAVLKIPQMDVLGLAGAPAGNWLTGFVPAASIIAAGLGIGWVNSAADYSRYLPRDSRAGSVVLWSTAGASIPPSLLIALGVVLVGSTPNLAESANPIGALADGLPTWFLIPYLVVAVGGLVAGAVLNIYSSGLNLISLGVRIQRYKSVAVDGMVMFLGNVYLLFFAKSFLGPFEGFLVVLGAPLSAWAAVFLVDMALFRRKTGYPDAMLRGDGPRAGIAALAALAVGTVVGLGLVTSTVGWLRWLGWWAYGPFAGSSLGIVAAFVCAGAAYPLLRGLPRLAGRPRPSRGA